MCVVSVRYPNGWREFRYLSRAPQCGDLFTHPQECYRVVAVEAGRHGYHDITVQLEAQGERIDETLEAA